MCGIAGIIGNTNGESVVVVQSMLQAMLHRGPDQDGIWHCGASPVFGHRRLSIIDLSEAGRQPMVDSPSGVSITYNGECYNFQELRSQLSAAGHEFHSASDTEVLLKAYLEWGNSFIDRLRGMFALAIWDPRILETILVRDRMGIKPLYYAMNGQQLMFASELRALLATNKVPRVLNPNAVAAYLWHGFVPGPETIISQVRRLDPGSYMRVDAQGQILEERRYWQMNIREDLSSADAPSYCRAELARATSEHMVSDVPLGVFLSGGVDSSVVTALAQRASNSPVTTFNIRFDEAEYDESRYARKVASVLGTEHQEITLTEAMFKDQWDDALGSLDQPTFDAINTYFVSRAVAQAGITVALAGTGGDELFGGYPSFKELRLARPIFRTIGTLPHSARRAVSKFASFCISGQTGEVRPQVRWGKFGNLVDTKGDLISLYQVFYSLFTTDFQQSLYRLPPHQLTRGLSRDNTQRLSQELRGQKGVLAQISHLEMSSFLGERLLPDTDAASMAVSLEVRVPLLDHQFVESLTRLADSERFEPLGRKNFLKSMVRNELDPKLFDRPKAGFELPMEKWCKNSLAADMEETFRDINLIHSVGLDAETLSRLWRSFKSGAPGLYWSRLWSLYVLISWCKRHRVGIG